jgi:hypothetical protein
MKVKELIEELKKLPQEANIYNDLGKPLPSPWYYPVSLATIEFDMKKVHETELKTVGRPCVETRDAVIGVILYVR